MSHQKIRGTDWEMLQESARREYVAKETVARPFLGIRLVNDDAVRVNQGSCWFSVPAHAQVAARDHGSPAAAAAASACASYGMRAPSNPNTGTGANMRKKAEVEKAEEGASDLLWYVRHKKRGIPEGTPESIVEDARKAATKIEATANPEYLALLLADKVSYGILVGRLTTLRWMLGMDWDEDGILDT